MIRVSLDVANRMTDPRSSAPANGSGVDRPALAPDASTPPGVLEIAGDVPPTGAQRTRVGFLSRHSVMIGALLVLASGIGIRVALAIRANLGHLPDTDFFVGWTRSMFAHGLGGFYEATAFCDYPPLAMLTIWAVGQLAALVGPLPASDHLLQALLKAPACLADLVIAITLLVEGRRLVGGKRAVAASALYFLNPVVIYNSAYWGQVDAVHTSLVLLSVVFVGRGKWGFAGGLIALALLQKFQSIAFLPLVIFQAYHYRRWRGVMMTLVGATFAAAWVLLPFALTGTMGDVLSRAYVTVVGQYSDLSPSAYNVWYLLGTPELPDTVVPRVVAAAAALGGETVDASGSPLLWLTWRHISLACYSLAVAVVLSILSRRPGGTSRMALAAMLGLAFFLFPTEMHERYAHPAIALLALWAVTSPWRERAFCLLSVLLLLNLTSILPAGDVAPYIAGSIIAVFVFVLGWTMIAKQTADADPAETHAAPVPLEQPPPPSRLITAFRRCTYAAVLAAIVGACAIGYAAAETEEKLRASPDVHLGDLRPITARQAWGELRINRNVVGGAIALGDTFYLRGLGTHARSMIEFDIPEGSETFESVVGIDRSAKGKGTAIAIVELDGERVFVSPMMTGADSAVPVSVPLGGARRIRLRADQATGGTTCDHVSWALARFTRQADPDEP